MKPKIIAAVLCLLAMQFAMSDGYISSLESIKLNKAPVLYRITNGTDIEQLKIGSQIDNNDTLQTNRYTKATLTVGHLHIQIMPLSKIVVKYAVAHEKQLLANYELKKGKLHVNFKSDGYDEKDLKIYIPSNKSVVLVKGTEFDVYSSGYVQVQKGTVTIEKTDDKVKVKVLKAGDFGSIHSEVINRLDSPEHDIYPAEHRDRRPAPEPKDKEPKGPAREPANAPGMNKAPDLKDRK